MNKINNFKNKISNKIKDLFFSIKEKLGINVNISINSISSLDNKYITIGIFVFYGIMGFIFIRMYLEKYVEFKENYISVINLQENINLLEDNKRKLKKNIKALEKIRTLEPLYVNFSQKLYEIETIIKRSARFVDQKFFIGVYEEKKGNLKVTIVGIMHYSDIKRILSNLRRPRNFYNIKEIKITFNQEIDKDTKKTDEFYNMELTLTPKYLGSK